MPSPTAEILCTLRRVWRFLDHQSDIALTEHDHALAWAYALHVAHVIDLVEGIAEADTIAALIDAIDVAHNTDRPRVGPGVTH